MVIVSKCVFSKLLYSSHSQAEITRFAWLVVLIFLLNLKSMISRNMLSTWTSYQTFLRSCKFRISYWIMCNWCVSIYLACETMIHGFLLHMHNNLVCHLFSNYLMQMVSSNSYLFMEGVSKLWPLDWICLTKPFYLAQKCFVNNEKIIYIFTKNLLI